MKNTIFALALIFCISITYSQSYKQIKIKLTDKKDVAELAMYDLDLEHSIFTKSNELILFVSDAEFTRLATLKFPVEILIDDWFEYFNNLPQMSNAEIEEVKSDSKSKYGVEGFGYGTFAGYYNLSEINANLDSMKVKYPNLITEKIPIGYSVENRPLYMVKISDNPNQNENEPEVLFTALTHAREPGGMMAVLYFMYYLLENYATNPSVKYLVDNREIYFVPCVNPDGYEYNRTTNPTGGGMWRKNRKNNSGTYGVDLNRNFGPMAYWNAPNGGSSTTPSSDTYRGTAPFSEPETQAIRDFVLGKQIRNCLNYHTYSNLLVFPYGALGTETPDSLIFREFAQDITAYNGYEYGTDLQTVGYSTRGGADDYLYDGDIAGQGKIFSMTPEVGGGSDGFWPSQSRIFPLAIENLLPNIYYTWVAGDYVKFNNASFDRLYFNPGDIPSMNVQLKNKGLSTANNLTINLISFNPFVTVLNGTTAVDSISARGILDVNNAFSFNISSNAPIEEEVKLGVRVLSNGVEMSIDTLKFIIGTPMFILNDTTNNPTNLWNLAASPSSAQWGTTTVSYVSSPNSYTDSPSGNYVANVTSSMTLKDNIDLTGIQKPILTFWTKYEIESDWDFGQVKITTNNGTSWTPLQGKYTQPGTGSFQPNGEPVYDGAKTSWSKEEINLSAYSGKQVKIMFQFKSDGSIFKDGWYLDDVSLIMYGVVPVEMISFTGNAKSKGIELVWSTATETNNRGFEIEKKSSTSDWTTIGFIPGKGTSLEVSEYSFSDIHPQKGKNIYRLVQCDFDGTINTIAPIEVDYSGVVSYVLSQNYPNPFNPATSISYELPEKSRVSLKIFDILGNEVAELVNSEQESGVYKIDFNAKNLASGTYIYRITAGSFMQTKKMTILK